MIKLNLLSLILQKGLIIFCLKGLLCEIEDIDALIEDTGGRAYLDGMSSEAILALEAAHRLGDKIPKLALFEPPLILDGSRRPLPQDYVEQLNESISSRSG